MEQGSITFPVKNWEEISFFQEKGKVKVTKPSIATENLHCEQKAESFFTLLFNLRKADQLHTTDTPFSFSAAMKNVNLHAYTI